MVLGRLGAAEPAFSQGSIAAFRDRLIEHDMDQSLLERTVALAKRTKEFDWRKLPKHLHLAIDSSPLEGAGRVEDTINLLGHAARKVVACAAALVGRSLEEVATEAGIPVLLGSSIKQALDVQWSDPAQKESGLEEFVSQLDSLERWLLQQLASESAKPPLREAIDLLRQLRGQDLEPDPGGGGTRIREGEAPDRRVSVGDPEMRHGRKSKRKLFNGYKQHLAVPAEPIRLGSPARFSTAAWDPCPRRVLCTEAAPGRGLAVSIASDEPLQQRLREASATAFGRLRLRTRTTVEHSLAHLARRQGRRARYRGVRKNLFDLRRASSVLNLETIHRQTKARPQKAAS